MTKISSVEDFQQLAGKQLGMSDWLSVSQDMINRFADATLDNQWIHTDIVKAKYESPFGGTIAHGYLTLSLLPYLLGQVIEVENLDHLVNYSVDKMVFKSAVKVGDSIRLYATLKTVKDLGDSCVATISCSMESKESDTQVMQGDIKFIYCFK